MNLTRSVISLVAALALTACNSDIFVADVRPGESSVTLAGDGGRAVVDFHPGGLRHIGLEDDRNGNCGRYFDASGQEVSPWAHASTVARISYETARLMFSVDVDGRKLIFESVENASVYSCTLLLRLDYEQISECISVEILPGQQRRLVSVDYDDHVLVNDKASTAILSMDVNNRAPTATVVNVRPYQGQQGTVTVDQQEQWGVHRLVEMPLPVYSDGRWRLGPACLIETGTTLRRTPTAVDPELVVPVEIPPHTTGARLETQVRFSSATANGVMTWENPVSGRRSQNLFECRAMEPVSHEIHLR